VNLAPLLQKFLETGLILVVDPKSDEIPEKERADVARGFYGGGSFSSTKGIACTIDREDGTLLIVTAGSITDEDMKHELIHCAQTLADPAMMQTCLNAAADLGAQVNSLIRNAVAGNESLSEGDHRDYYRTRNAWQFSNSQGAKPVPPDLHLFDDLRTYYPTPQTQALATTVGLTNKESVYAAMSAGIMREVAKEIDPMSDTAREIVAYTFQASESPVIDQLFEVAINNAEDLVSRLQAAPAL
jgi:hypothetical protein